MKPRKFAVGNRVRLLLEHHAADSPADVYEVSRMLPARRPGFGSTASSGSAMARSGRSASRSW